MTLVYAASTDLTADWLGTNPVPANAAQQLRIASGLVTEATECDFYTVDTAGMPADAAILQACKDATCAQVGAWVAAGVDPAGTGMSPTPAVRGKGIGTARLEYDTSLQASVAAFEARQKLTSELCPDASRILRAVGLASTAAWVIG